MTPELFKAWTKMQYVNNVAIYHSPVHEQFQRFMIVIIWKGLDRFRAVSNESISIFTPSLFPSHRYSQMQL